MGCMQKPQRTPLISLISNTRPTKNYSHFEPSKCHNFVICGVIFFFLHHLEEQSISLTSINFLSSFEYIKGGNIDPEILNVSLLPCTLENFFSFLLFHTCYVCRSYVTSFSPTEYKSLGNSLSSDLKVFSIGQEKHCNLKKKTIAETVPKCDLGLPMDTVSYTHSVSTTRGGSKSYSQIPKSKKNCKVMVH